MSVTIVINELSADQNNSGECTGDPYTNPAFDTVAHLILSNGEEYKIDMDELIVPPTYSDEEIEAELVELFKDSNLEGELISFLHVNGVTDIDFETLHWDTEVTRPSEH